MQTFSTSPPLPITLGAKVKSQLLRSFEDNDLSLEAVIAAIKVDLAGKAQ